MVVVEVAGALLELGELLARLERPLVAEQPLHVHPRKDGISMRWRMSSGRMSPTVCVAALVWPLAWQSMHDTPMCRGSVAVVEQDLEVSSVTCWPLDTSPRSGRVVKKDRRRELWQQMLQQVEVEVETPEIASVLALGLVDQRLRKNHAAASWWGCSSGRKPPDQTAMSARRMWRGMLARGEPVPAALPRRAKVRFNSASSRALEIAWLTTKISGSSPLWGR